jgi:hypothetical protein
MTILVAKENVTNGTVCLSVLINFLLSIAVKVSSFSEIRG